MQFAKRTSVHLFCGWERKAMPASKVTVGTKITHIIFPMGQLPPFPLRGGGIFFRRQHTANQHKPFAAGFSWRCELGHSLLEVKKKLAFQLGHSLLEVKKKLAPSIGSFFTRSKKKFSFSIGSFITRSKNLFSFG